jgi:cytochrome b pre-mRNA-processing protein 3
MREAGVGDLGVGKKIRKMAQAYYGRAAAYDEALGKAAPVKPSAKAKTALADVLQRNLYPDTPDAADAKKLKALASYLLAFENKLADVTLDNILAGKF